MATKIVVTPQHDSDNTNPPDVVLVPHRDRITLLLEGPERHLTLPFDTVRLAVKQCEELQWDAE